jgi:hypothetical protein
MATSGSVVYNQSANDICKAALRKIGILAEGEEPTGQIMLDTREALNRLAKEWQTDGLHLWKQDEIVVFPKNSNPIYYTFGASNDYAVLNSELIETYLTVAASTSNTSITVYDDDGITNAYYIGIVLNNNTIQWSTVNGTPSANVIQLNNALTSGASINNKVYCFQNKISKPLRILNGRLAIDSNNETQLREISHNDYFRLSNRSSVSCPSQYFYNPRLDTGRLYIYPLANDAQYIMKFTIEKAIEDFLTGSDNPDFPQEWLNALIWNLAEDMALEFGARGEVLEMITMKAQKSYEKILGWDRETAPITFQPTFYP